MAKPDYIVKPVQKALQVLDCLGQEKRELSLGEICRRVGLPKTTTFRYLHTLRASGLVAHDPEAELYRLGPRLWELAQSVGEQLQIRKAARPYMEQLRDRFNETVNLAVLDGSEIVYLEMVESKMSLRMQASLGGRDPVYSTALGKAILAYLPEEEWRDHLPARLARRTPRTLTSLAALREELIETRARGYSRDLGENEAGARCVGVPILDQREAVLAALSLSAPAVRFDDRSEREAAAALLNAARMISRRLGRNAGGRG
jgi:IclR family acetate operon transcriptional repressor